MKFNILLLFVALLATTTQIQAQATLSMQGTIRNSTGAAVSDGTYSITFKLYTAESGGTPVWTETQDNIKVTGGVYSALLGSSNPLNAAFNVPYYVGIAVDGGSELIPRFRLTSAPYALALIGQSNTFPSAGNVGVGTVTPEARLHVNNSDGDAVQFITAPNDKNANLRLSTGNHTGYLNVSQDVYQIGSENKSINIVPASSDGRVNLYGNGGLKAYTFADGLYINGALWATSSILAGTGNYHSAPGKDLALYRDTDLHMLCRGDGWTEMRRGVYIPGQTSYYFQNNFIAWNSGLWFPQGQQTNQGVSILANANIAAPNFFVLSDGRIKKDLKLSSGKQDLATLMQLEVTKYRHVDSLAKGPGMVTGFIAQQVEKVFPEAVTITTDVVPDIYSFPVTLSVDGEAATFTLEKAHSLSAGSHVRIFTRDDSQNDYEVVRVVNDHSFTVKDWHGTSEASNTFVFGEKVNDFRKVDYDKIHNLNVSATQELARQIELLRAENAELRGKYELMLHTNEAVNGRLAKLEALLDDSASRR